jgi:hypothetical protein
MGVLLAPSATQAPYAGLSEGGVRLRKSSARAGLPQPAGCPPALEALLEACLALEPAHRPPAGKVAAELRAALRATWGGDLLWPWPSFS